MLSAGAPTESATLTAPLFASAALARVDWRFLLDHPQLGRTAVIGAPDDLLMAGLRLVAPSVEVNPIPAEFAHHDLVVVAAPTRDDLGAAATLLRPDGQLYLELPHARWPFLTPLSRRRWRRRLVAAGFGAPSAYWHVPTFAATTHLVRLVDRAALRVVAGRHQGTLKGALKGALLRGAAATNTATLIARDVSVIVRRRPTSGV
jgi:hypothetical protein